VNRSEPTPPPGSQDLISRLESLSEEPALSAGEALLALPGNPYGVTARVVEGARVFATPSLSHFPPLNRCFGIHSPGQLGGVLAFYRRYRAPANIALASDRDTPELLVELCRHGLRPVSRCAIMLGAPAPPDLSNGYLAIQQVDEASFDAFLGVYLEAFQVPKVDREWTRAVQHHRLHRPGWRLYLARHGREPAAVGQLFIRGDLALLCGAGTRPDRRRRGCQRGLLVHRLREAARLGCDLVLSQAALGTTSQANLARAGLIVADIQTAWAAPSPPN